MKECDVVTINGVEYVRKDSVTQAAQYKDYVLVRTYSAGVHFGHLSAQDGKMVTLQDTRRIWSWAGAASLSQMALEGTKKPKECKFSVTLPAIQLTEAIEIIPCTKEAVDSIRGVPEWKM